jgi:nicotinate-nucleotide adenylyltransferase
MRVGILGGTFDPIHLGHLIVAEEARLARDLEQVIFVPAGQPRLKGEEPLATAEQRLRMVELAVSSNPHFRVVRDEVDRSGPTYTVETLRQLKQDLGNETTLCFILGLDALAQFHRWKDPEGIIDMCELVIASRPGFQNTGILDEQLARYPTLGAKTSLLNLPRIDISSTDIRQRASRGGSLRYLVPDEVSDYARREGLYGLVPGPRP